MPAAARASTPAGDAHVPVLLGPLLDLVSPVAGRWLDGTLGAGGFARALLDAGAAHVTAIDRDPSALETARGWAGAYGGRLALAEGTFGALDRHGAGLDGVVLDLGVSSMQLDRPERGFSFMADGPLDMRMGADGPTAADLVNGLPEGELADILFRFGEERASRRVARAIVAARPLETTLQLAGAVASCLPRPRPGQAHPATRSFLALRIAVNGELDQLADGLEAAERALAPGGRLAVVSFHSLEDRVVKAFLRLRSGGAGPGNRHAPEAPPEAPRFRELARGGVVPDAAEVAANPRARSARLRVAARTDAPAGRVDRAALGLPERPRGGTGR